jgi:2-polyprenyl-3-methyl-5-hydroxy-6-metoxy-1,4-benzoquinol methylase
MEYDHRAGFVLGLVNPGPGKRILDVGCDWGYACMAMARAGAEARGIDIDKNSVEFGLRLAAANGIEVHLQYAHARALPFPDAHFDAVVAIETIEHVQVADRPRVFAEMNRVLKPNGVVVLSTPNPRGLSELAKRTLGRFRFLRRRFYGGYRDEARVKTFPWGDVMVDVLLARQELAQYLAGTNLRLQAACSIVFVTKFLPEWLLGPAKLVEAVLERVPLIQRFASTSVYVLRRQPDRTRPHPPITTDWHRLSGTEK